MREERFEIFYPKTKPERTAWNRQYGLNAIYAGKHWTARKKDSEFWHSMVTACLLRSKIPHKLFESPVKITFWWNDNLDISNHAYMGKMIEDALKGWIIKDDSRKYVVSMSHEFHDEDYILVEITEATK